MPLGYIPDLHFFIPAIRKDNMADARTFDYSVTSALLTDFRSFSFFVSQSDLFYLLIVGAGVIVASDHTH
jgi:hypothetical protein